MLGETIVNIMAMAFSLIGIILLIDAAMKIGGAIGKTIKIIVAGIFFAVFIHAAFELAAAFNLVNKETLLPVMGALLIIGSLCFIWAGINVRRIYSSM